TSTTWTKSSVLPIRPVSYSATAFSRPSMGRPLASTTKGKSWDIWEAGKPRSQPHFLSSPPAWARWVCSGGEGSAGNQNRNACMQDWWQYWSDSHPFGEAVNWISQTLLAVIALFAAFAGWI